MVELRKLSPDDGNDIYELLQLIPKDENGLINKANGLSFEEYKQWLINKQIESEQKGLVDGWKVPSTTYWLYVDNVPVGFGSIREFLTDALRVAGGNIGYGIAKPYRGKGYGKGIGNMVELRKLSPDDGNDIYELLQLIPKDENGLINKANGLSFEEYKQWLINKQIESEQKGLVDGWKVPSTTYWLYVDNVPVGFGSIREFLTDALRVAGGNIGYGIAKPYRGKGYGKELLKLLLEKANESGIDKVLITIHKENVASRAVAEVNGAILEKETEERAYYWIESER